MRHVYFDEAGLANPEHEPYTVVAGFMLHVDEQYTAIQKYLLDMADDLVGSSRDRPLNFVFHAMELWHGTGFFPKRTWDLDKRLEILRHLADIPAKFELPIIYSCVERKKYLPKELPRKRRKAKAARAAATRKCHLICFVSCLSQTEELMKHAYNDEKAFVIVENHQDHKGQLLDVAQLLANPRARPTIENDPNIGWPALTHIVEEPLFVQKSGSSPIQIADMCAFILSRSLAGANHSEEFLERIKPQLVRGFIREFIVDSSRGEFS